MQMSFAAMLIESTHAAFEDRKEAFDCVGVDHAAHILAMRMCECVVTAELLTKLGIEVTLVGMQPAFAADVADHDISDVCEIGVFGYSMPYVLGEAQEPPLGYRAGLK
jgi:hypothetical protein